MPRRSRLHVPDGIYYVVQRSHAGQRIFGDEVDYDTFERLLARTLLRCRARVHAYCWESDAIHLVLQVSDVPIGRLMQRLSSQYARRLHRRAGRPGQLFRERHHALLIDPSVYLLRLIRHVHSVPLHSGKAAAGEHRLSSHEDYAGTTETPWLTTNVALGLLGQTIQDARLAYHRLMTDVPSPAEAAMFDQGGTDDPRVLGDRNFVTSIESMRPHRSTPSLEQVIEEVVDTLGLERTEVLSRSRRRRLALARALITWRANERGVASLADVARGLQRDPSTLLVAVERYRALRPDLFDLAAFREWAPSQALSENGVKFVSRS